MPTISALRSTVDQFVTDRWPTIVARQENYRTNRGAYWQGTRTHSATPSYTNSSGDGTVADQLDSSPADAFQNWSNVFPEWAGVVLPCCVRVDAYSGPSGHGWLLVVEVVHNGTTWVRTVNVGPESSRAHGWKAITRPGG